MRFRFLACLLLSVAQQVVPQTTFRVVTFNLLQYYPSSGYTRDQYFRTVVQSVNPDVLVVQEIDTASAVLNFLANVLNTGGQNQYSPGLFKDGSFDSENAIFYRKGEFEFIDNIRIKTALRDINQFIVRHVASDRILTIFSVHLKAGVADSIKRAMEVDSLRRVTNDLPAGTDFIVVGDFNIYRSSEPAYQKLVAAGGNEGYLVDPLVMPGVWNDAAYSRYHTQSTRGGSSGGLDDRFDMILMSKAVSEPGGLFLVPESYKAFGNDGLHYNDSINSRPNAAVADSVADALHAASDHLPVVAEFVFDPAVGVERYPIPGESFLSPNYPNPFNPMTAFSYQVSAFSNVRLSVFDVLGREVAVLVNEEKEAGSYRVTWDASDKPSGVYFCRMTSGSYVETRRVLLIR